MLLFRGLKGKTFVQMLDTNFEKIKVIFFSKECPSIGMFYNAKKVVFIVDKCISSFIGLILGLNVNSETGCWSANFLLCN